jgi:hypothetical protein
MRYRRKTWIDGMKFNSNSLRDIMVFYCTTPVNQSWHPETWNPWC